MDEYRLALAQNVATNGRLFCVLIFAICLAAFMAGQGMFFGRLAVLAALPVGASCICDQLPNGRPRAIAAALIYAFTIAVVILLLLNLR